MQSKLGSQPQVLVIILLTIASLYFTWTLVDLVKEVRAFQDLKARRTHTVRPIESYSLIGTDHPKRLPVQEKLVKMTVEESVHYSLIEPESELEWLWTATVGDGHVRIGEAKRMFAVAMFHQLHCLRGVRESLTMGWSSLHSARQHHILHCFNYLRQWTLCSADVTLEKGDFTKRNFTSERVGATHTCIDWRPSYDFMKEKWIAWAKYRIEHNIPDHPEQD